MKVTIDNARLIEDGRVAYTVRLCEEGLTFEADSPEAAQQQIEVLRADLLALVQEKQSDIVKEGAAYAIDLNYTFQE
ncbi:MAG: hypothetical protein K2L50_07365 [Bacteroidales bacterium]|nr:hypothetical protein [Bacteroidales bacterium]